jgi:CRISPR-associated protein Csb2
LRRLNSDSGGNQFFNPVPALTAFAQVHYRRDVDVPVRPSEVFLLQGDERTKPFVYSQEKLIHISGMVRRLAIKAMKLSPPRDVPSDWLETFVAGHASNGGDPNPRFSYVPLPSIGHQHADHGIRRIMVIAPPGTEHWLEHLTRLISGMDLEPERNVRMPHPPTLVSIRGDNVARHFLRASQKWASVTPVILPGHDDKSPAKTRRLIERALQHSGITISCKFDWSPFSQFPKSLSAHKYGKSNQPTGYVRPDHLKSQTAIHLTLTFADPVAGPLVIGAGRHYGFGLMAPVLQ